MIGCTRMHSCDPGLQRNHLRHNFHITPTLAPERPACWSRLKRMVQLSCETRSVPCHTFQWRCHLVSRAHYLPGRGRWCIACCCSCPFVAIVCLKHVFVASSFCIPSGNLASNPCKPQLHVKWNNCRDWGERPGINPEPPTTSCLSRVFAPQGGEAAMPAFAPP